MLTNPGVGWRVIAAADFNGDGNADILFQNNDGAPLILEMNGTSIVAAATLSDSGTQWHSIGTGDFNGDGMSDILLQNSNGTPLIWQMNAAPVVAEATPGEGSKSDNKSLSPEEPADSAHDPAIVHEDATLLPEGPLPSFDPPALAEFALRLLARSKSQQGALGDLNETFNRNCVAWGRKRAVRIYWAEALRSLGPLLMRMGGRIVKWGAVADAIKTHFLS